MDFDSSLCAIRVDKQLVRSYVLHILNCENKGTGVHKTDAEQMNRK